jgi:thioredoxin-related protein
MKNKLFILFGIMFCAVSVFGQVKSLDEAESQAQKEGKLILLKFSGSDWCIPCIQLQKTIVDDAAFADFAKEKLVILLADFPRQKKHQLPKPEQDANDKLAEVYNPEGEFPHMVLLDAQGKVLYKWNGYDKKHTVQDYIADISHYTK